jgi:hypothetical protein
VGVLWIEVTTSLVNGRSRGKGLATVMKHNCPIGYERTECNWIELIVAEYILRNYSY